MNGYKTYPGCNLEWIFDQPFLIADRSARKKFPAVMPLNVTAAQIWGALCLGKNPDLISQELAEDYNLDKERVLNDVMAFCEDLFEKGYLIRQGEMNAG